jgi:UDP-glucose 4-epimerase
MAHTRSVVTGVAGFIGSHLAEQLLARGQEVVGIDAFTPYYDPAQKRANLAALLNSPRFRLVDADLATADLPPLLDGVDYVYHQAAQAGVRASWGESFATYTHHNVLATQRLLEAVKGQPIRKLVYASSSSVYGDARLPMRETARPQPVSPYGVSKLAAEHLCHLYHVAYDVPTVSLRYFTVYGPRQRTVYRAGISPMSTTSWRPISWLPNDRSAVR